MPSIIRVEHNKDRPYLIISKELVNDASLDCQSLGLLVVILAKPDSWRVRPEELAKEREIGRATCYRIIKKLIEAGYIQREDITRRKDNGQYEKRVIYTVYEDRQLAKPNEERTGSYCGQVVPF